MPQHVKNFEECPLNNHNQCQKRPRNFKGPYRVLRLCILGIVLPGILVAVPLYLRYHVYGYQLYPLAMSDMRMLDGKVSTTWCQRQLVSVNTTFNAFLLSETPKVSDEVKPISMVRHLTLRDDTKEYWGFYLLKGSSVTVSTCVRWPGASLIVIRGHKHLHECAYIGDNSSEEFDEVQEAIKDGTYIQPNKTQSTTSKPNAPSLMKRHRNDVEFHHPKHRNSTSNHTLANNFDTSEVTDPKQMKKILELIQQKKEKATRAPQKTEGKKRTEEIEEKELLEEEIHMHVHRNSTVAKGESKNFEFLKQTDSEEVINELLGTLQKLGSSRGDSLLKKLNDKYRSQSEVDVRNDLENGDNLLDVKGRHYARPPVNYNEDIDRSRKRREIEIGAALRTALNENDEENDAATEEDYFSDEPVKDGIADDRGTINETDLNDRSNSEFWSSFSSSEEALLNCNGLILNLPLTPHKMCHSNLTEKEAEEAYLANTITYRVPTNGYYFFVFNSENEIQDNYLRVLFHLKKTYYNVSEPVAACSNSSEKCAVPLRFFSSEKLVMELPVQNNDTLWNEEYVVVSECEPRTALYVICVIAVPVLVILFAFT